MDYEHITRLFNTIWNYKLFPIAGNQIGVNNILILLLLLVFGFKYIKNLSGTVNNYLTRKLEPNAAQNLGTLITYAIRIIYLVIILSIANIPLSGFAFISGALAFGLGFGAQTLLSNFISSLIIMSEQLIKIGEIIKIKETIGIVKSIRMRCILIRTYNNHDILIPSSEVILNNVEKFTIDDYILRYQIELTISKQDLNMDINSFIQQLKDLTSNMDFISDDKNIEVFCTSIDKENFNFTLKFNLAINKINDLDHIKNTINIAFFSKIQSSSLSIKYLN